MPAPPSLPERSEDSGEGEAVEASREDLAVVVADSLIEGMRLPLLPVVATAAEKREAGSLGEV